MVSADPVLASGEPGFIVDSNTLKIVMAQPPLLACPLYLVGAVVVVTL